MATYSTILTIRGKQLVVAASVSGSLIPVVTGVIGDGGGTATTPNENQTSLVRQVFSTTLNSIEVDPNDSTQYIAEFVIPAATGGFTIREVGLKTSDGDLFAVGNTPQVYKPSASEGSFSDTTVRIYFKVSNAGTVQVVVDPNVAVATRQWVVNYVSPANIIPGGLTSQFLSKKSNADGDFVWVDPTQGVQVIVDTVEEKQTLAAGQTAVILSTVTTKASAVYIEGVRLAKTEWTKVDDTHLTLGQSYPDGTSIVIVQNEQTGQTDVLRRGNNLMDVENTATARFNIGAAASARLISTGTGLLGGGNLAADRTLSVDFADSGTVSTTQAVRADDVRLADARPPLPHTHAAGDIISGSFGVPRGGTGLTSVTAGYFLAGNGTGNLVPRSPAQVLSDVGAASASHTHNIADVNGLQTALNSKMSNGGIYNTPTLQFTSGAPPSINIIDSTGNTRNVPLQIGNGANPSASAVMGFIREGSFGAYFGLDTDNAWKVGGWSMGSVSYRVVHEGLGTVNFPGTVTAAGGFQQSDRRLKTNIKPRAVLRGIALKIARKFAEWDRISDGVHDVGLVAQIVERIAPWYVKRGEDKRRLRAIDKAGIALECSMDNALAIDELVRRIERLERAK